jgi:hypothetical protein
VLLSKRDTRGNRITWPREDQAPFLDFDPQGIAFAETGSREPLTAEADHRDGHSRIEIRGHHGFPVHQKSSSSGDAGSEGTGDKLFGKKLLGEARGPRDGRVPREAGDGAVLEAFAHEDEPLEKREGALDRLLLGL